jgi:hypothetical protein
MPHSTLNLDPVQEHGVGRASDASARARRLHIKQENRHVGARVHGRQASGETEAGGGLEQELELLRQELAGEMLPASAPAPAPPSNSLHASVDTRTARQLPRTTHRHNNTTATAMPRRPTSATYATTNTNAAPPDGADGGRGSRRRAAEGQVTRACSAGASGERRGARARVELDRCGSE